jgi:hypothetical protein
MHVFHFLVTSDHPELLGRHLRAPEMLQLLLRLETSPTAPAAPLAREILTTLGKEMLGTWGDFLGGKKGEF